MFILYLDTHLAQQLVANDDDDDDDTQTFVYYFTGEIINESLH